MELQAIFFDLDGTLISHQKQIKNFIGYQFGRFKKEFEGISFDSWEKEFVRLDANGYVTKDIVYRELSEKFHFIHEIEHKLYQDFVNHFHHYIAPFDHLYRTLFSLKDQGYLLGLMTNGGYEIQKRKIERLSFEHIFDTLIISEQVGYEKPDPKIFQLGTNDLQVPAENCVFIGDHIENDILGPQNLGMKTIWMANKEVAWPKGACSDAVINHLVELEAALQTLKK